MAQAAAYLEEIFACFGRATAAPGTGQDRSAFVAGARSLRAGQHLLFHRDTAEGIVILRVIHERRNFSALSFADDLD